MEEVLARQQRAAKPLTGGAFLRGVAVMIVKLAVAQVIVNLAITVSGVGLLNIAFYVYAVCLMVAFMRRTVAGSVYVLRPGVLTLSKMLGDSTTSVVEIPTKDIVSVRPVLRGERLACSYHRVTVIDADAAQGLRMSLAFALSLFSARLSRRLAGRAAGEARGYAVAYMEDGKRQACVFRPDEAFLGALRALLPERVGLDDRQTCATMMAQALKRAFPEIYTFAEPLISPEREQAAREEVARQRAARRSKDQPSQTKKDEPAHRRRK